MRFLRYAKATVDAIEDEFLAVFGAGLHFAFVTVNIAQVFFLGINVLAKEFSLANS